MTPKTLERLSTDWFDVVKQELDALREDCYSRGADFGPMPSAESFKLAQDTVEKFRQLADFPALPEADIWAGVSGEIGIAWAFPDATVELTVTSRVVARVFNETDQTGLELSQVPVMLKKLTEKAAAAK